MFTLFLLVMVVWENSANNSQVENYLQGGKERVLIA